MYRLVAVAATAVALALPSAAPAADKDCSDFNSWRAAQKFFKKHGGPRYDPHRLDADNDGVACENYQGYPEGSPRDETPVGAATGGGGDTDGENGLPFTGPNDTLLPAGTALLALGLMTIMATRYRGRHARR